MMTFFGFISFISQYFFGDDSARRLKIPTSILKSIPNTVYLLDKYDNSWPVQIGVVGGQWFFMGGWIKFIKDNLIVPGDMISFDYVDHGVFKVKLFDSEGWDKKEVESCNVLDKQMHETKETSQEKDKARGKAIMIGENKVKNSKDNNNENDGGETEKELLNSKMHATELKSGVRKRKHVTNERNWQRKKSVRETVPDVHVPISIEASGLVKDTTCYEESDDESITSITYKEFCEAVYASGNCGEMGESFECISRDNNQGTSETKVSTPEKQCGGNNK